MLKLRLSLAALYMLCTVLMFRDPSDLAGSEFSGGLLTGRLSDLHFAGALLLAASVLLALLSPRIAALAALPASLFCAPLYLYFVFPGVFRWAFSEEWSKPTPAFFVANMWAIGSILALALADAVSLYNLTILTNRSSKGE